MSSSSKNRRFWNSTSNAYQEAHGPVLSQTPLAWGVWRIPESDLGVLGHVEERDVLELGCGAAQWTLALRQKGARAVGLDLSEEQLAHARALSRPVTAIPLVQANAETLPFRKEAFDVVFCDHEPRSLRLRKRSWRRCRECFGPPVSLPFACRRQSGTCASTPSERRSRHSSTPTTSGSRFSTTVSPFNTSFPMGLGCDSFVGMRLCWRTSSSFRLRSRPPRPTQISCLLLGLENGLRSTFGRSRKQADAAFLTTSRLSSIPRE